MLPSEHTHICDAVALCPPQDDIVHEDLTVRENLAYSAKLRCAVSEAAVQLSEVVDDVVELLRLRHVQHSVVGSVEKRGVRHATPPPGSG